jgi:hypothetical protein
LLLFLVLLKDGIVSVEAPFLFQVSDALLELIAVLALLLRVLSRYLESVN